MLEFKFFQTDVELLDATIESCVLQLDRFHLVVADHTLVVMPGVELDLRNHAEIQWRILWPRRSVVALGAPRFDACMLVPPNSDDAPLQMAHEEGLARAPRPEDTDRERSHGARRGHELR